MGDAGKGQSRPITTRRASPFGEGLRYASNVLSPTPVTTCTRTRPSLFPLLYHRSPFQNTLAITLRPQKPGLPPHALRSLCRCSTLECPLPHLARRHLYAR